MAFGRAAQAIGRGIPPLLGPSEDQLLVVSCPKWTKFPHSALTGCAWRAGGSAQIMMVPVRCFLGNMYTILIARKHFLLTRTRAYQVQGGGSH